MNIKIVPQTRLFDHKKYHLKGTFFHMSQARKEALRMRKMGFKARAVKLPATRTVAVGYAVYYA